MNTNMKTARSVAVLFLMATATYMVGNGLLQSILSAQDYLSHVYPNKTQVILGVLLMYVDCAAVVGIGVMFFPILRKHNERIALGYAGTRILECAFLVVGGISSLVLLALSQEYLEAGTPHAAYFQTLGTVLMAQSQYAYQIAMAALGLGSLFFCALLYRTQLVPRSIALLGMIGYAALFIGALLQFFGFDIALVLSIPGALFELILPLWLIAKGFNSSATVSEPAKTAANVSEQIGLANA